MSACMWWVLALTPCIIVWWIEILCTFQYRKYVGLKFIVGICFYWCSYDSLFSLLDRNSTYFLNWVLVPHRLLVAYFAFSFPSFIHFLFGLGVGIITDLMSQSAIKRINNSPFLCIRWQGIVRGKLDQLKRCFEVGMVCLLFRQLLVAACWHGVINCLRTIIGTICCRERSQTRSIGEYATDINWLVYLCSCLDDSDSHIIISCPIISVWVLFSCFLVGLGVVYWLYDRIFLLIFCCPIYMTNIFCSWRVVEFSFLPFRVLISLPS